MDVLVIGGPAGVGKSTVAHELSRQLEQRQVAHALIDTDELDRIYPVPPDLHQVTEESLAAVWSALRRHGAQRLILVGVYLEREEEREWISRAVPDADITCVRLTAAEATLRKRILDREIGSGADDQIERTKRQLEVFASKATGSTQVLPTDGRSPVDSAAEIAAFWPP